MKRTLSILLVLASTWCARAVTLEWDASPDVWVTGYRLYCGTNSVKPLTNAVIKIDVGTNLTATVSNLVTGKTYYFVATCYTAEGLESPPSNEVMWTVPFEPLNLRTVIVQWSGAVASTNWQDAVFFKFKIP